ncbi:hypothetical protein QA649_37485 [Bradyrhizobium sp. CB1717]|uniref:hypothetical protein n=1 Tax=Bradyrhizobium sp. CB1717 TaxID=3039154 RepID=UPI0024B17AF5|nr:hypothetical protein [Bradyrhizobium sp. CB1717]WFU23646.1 hypothetical protein QA649_37485 [Bradyrhizobium sp. CB1717]
MKSYDNPKPMPAENRSKSRTDNAVPISSRYFRMNDVRAHGGLYSAAYLAFAAPPMTSVHQDPTSAVRTLSDFRRTMTRRI